MSSSNPSVVIAQAMQAVDEVQSDFASYNIAPTAMIYTVIETSKGERRLALRKWGLVPTWAKDPSIGNKAFNARLETLNEKASFKNAARFRRCLVPIDGYYEWQQLERGKQPWFIHGLGRKGLVLAGLYETWRDVEGRALETTTVITTAATEATEHIHSRRPLVVPKEHWDEWLDPKITNSADMLHTLDQTEPAVELHKVGVDVGNVRNDTPALKEPVDS